MDIKCIFLGSEVQQRKSNHGETQFPIFKPLIYHGNITRIEAEDALTNESPGSFLVRNSESTKSDYALSLRYLVDTLI